MKNMSEDPKYDKKKLEKLWNLSYKDLVMAAEDGLRLPRFVLQAKVATQTGYMIWMTFAMVLATFAMAIATFFE